MILVITDNLNRDYQPTYIVEVNLTKEKAEESKKYKNNLIPNDSDIFYDIRPDDWVNSMESIYDLTDEIPTFEHACQMFGIDKLGIDRAKEMYNNKYIK